MYNKYEDLRDKVARGNTVLYLNDMQEGKVSYDNLVFALRKFTGGMGDEDDFNPSEAKASE